MDNIDLLLIKSLEKLLAAQTTENKILCAENRMLWDLIRGDGSAVPTGTMGFRPGITH